MKTTANYALQIPEATDTVNLLTQNYPNFETIDTAMKANKDAAITTATEVKTGTNHAILRSNDGSNMFRFVATSNMVAGDTFTVDSVVVTATTPDGKTLADGAFVINQNVLCCLVGTLMTVYAGGSASEVETAKDSEKLGGELPTYYGKASDIVINHDLISQNTTKIEALEDAVKNIKHTYSTEEHVAGTWIDGSTVYEKTFVYDNSTGATTVQIGTIDSTYGIVVNLMTSFYSSTYSAWQTSSTYAFALVAEENNSTYSRGTVVMHGSSVKYKAYITVQYTK